MPAKINNKNEVTNWYKQMRLFRTVVKWLKCPHSKDPSPQKYVKGVDTTMIYGLMDVWLKINFSVTKSEYSLLLGVNVNYIIQ